MDTPIKILAFCILSFYLYFAFHEELNTALVFSSPFLLNVPLIGPVPEMLRELGFLVLFFFVL
jgi:hypothetical protein